MIALDTNVIARFYIEEPAAKRSAKTGQEADRAAAIMQSGRRLWVAKTVLLELEWVCRGVYKLDSSAFGSIAEHLISLPKVEVEDFSAVRKALDWYLQGLDFADALHLSSSANTKEFVTFDKRRFANRAQRLATLPPVTTP